MSNQVIATLKLTRPSSDIAWSSDIGKNLAYFKAVYLDTGKALSRTQSLSEDGLTKTTVTVWSNEEERSAYSSNPMILSHIKDQANYMKSVNIQVSWSNQEISPDGTIIKTWSGEGFPWISTT
jgi:hypothetical protein